MRTLARKNLRTTVLKYVNIGPKGQKDIIGGVLYFKLLFRMRSGFLMKQDVLAVQPYSASETGETS